MAATVPAGKLDKRVVILQDTSASKDEFGQPEQQNAWVEVASRWACIEPLTGRELWQAAQVRAELTHRVTVRAVGLELTAKHRFKFTRGTKVLILNIASVADPDMRGEYLACMCIAEVANVTNPEA